MLPCRSPAGEERLQDYARPEAGDWEVRARNRLDFASRRVEYCTPRNDRRERSRWGIGVPLMPGSCALGAGQAPPGQPDLPSAGADHSRSAAPDLSIRRLPGRKQSELESAERPKRGPVSLREACNLPSREGRESQGQTGDGCSIASSLLTRYHTGLTSRQATECLNCRPKTSPRRAGPVARPSRP